MKSAEENLLVVEEYLAKEVESGWVLGPLGMGDRSSVLCQLFWGHTQELAAREVEIDRKPVSPRG